MSESVLPMFSSRSFIVSGLTLRYFYLDQISKQRSKYTNYLKVAQTDCSVGDQDSIPGLGKSPGIVTPVMGSLSRIILSDFTFFLSKIYNFNCK